MSGEKPDGTGSADADESAQTSAGTSAGTSAEGSAASSSAVPADLKKTAPLLPGQGAPLHPGEPESVSPPISSNALNLGALAYAGFAVVALIIIVIVLVLIFRH